MSAGSDSPALDTSTESLGLENLRLSQPDDDDDLTRERAASESVGGDFHADSQSPGRGPASYQPTPPVSVWCSSCTVRQQPELRLLLRDLERARTREERQECGGYISDFIGTPKPDSIGVPKSYSIDVLDRVLSKVRPFNAVKLSSASSSSTSDKHRSDRMRPSTSLGHSSSSFSVDPSTLSTTPSAEDTVLDNSDRPSVTPPRAQAPTTKRLTFRRRDASFCKRVLSSTLVRGDQWNPNRYRPTIFDPVLQKVTVHITNFRNPAEEVTLSMSYSSSVTSHNSRVFTDDIQRLHGRKEQLTRKKVLKVEQRLATQRRRRRNTECARIMELTARRSDADTRRPAAPRLLVRERSKQDQHKQTNSHTDMYRSLNKEC